MSREKFLLGHNHLRPLLLAHPSCFLHSFLPEYFFTFQIGRSKNQNLHSFWNIILYFGSIIKSKKRCRMQLRGIGDNNHDLKGCYSYSLSTYLGHKNAIIIELGLQDLLIEGFGVELIAWPIFKWVCQISNNDIKLFLSLLQFSPSKMRNVIGLLR